jgi:DNA ligase D-like protein (predicted 3'-phosphoesterase)
MAPEFVIQQHAATTLHYDLRLEVEGVLRSWAVPKGPSSDPAQRRLAVEVEDHSRSWGGFEGRIGGGYGKGAVIVWDRGTFENVTERDGAAVPIAEALDDGHAVVRFAGEKLRGAYLLQRTGGGAKPRWLFVKLRDAEADTERDLVAELPRSVVSGRTIDELRSSGGPPRRPPSRRR